MTDRSAIVQLRKVLAILYVDVSSIRRIVNDAGIDPTAIEFQGSASNIWFSVLDNTEKQNQIEALINIVRSEYPANQEFAHASMVYEQHQQSLDATETLPSLQDNVHNGLQVEQQKERSEYPREQAHDSGGSSIQALGSQQENSFRQHYEAEGDQQVKLAKQADQKDTHKHWQAAQQAYNQALGVQPRPETLDMIRLYRKTAFVFRKQERIDLAKLEYLDRGRNLIQRVSSSLAQSPRLLLEKALYLLEDAYCNYKEAKWREVKTQTAELIEQYSTEKILALDADFLYIVGCAYNLRAIVLQYLSAPQEDIDWCWHTAQSYLQRANTPDANEVLRDIKLNLAAQQTMWGHTDSAIKTFEQVLVHEKTTPSLPAERRIGVQHTLATCYLDRMASHDIDKASLLATENLTWSKAQERTEEWFDALYLHLDVIKALIVTTRQDNVQTFIEQARHEYYAFRRANRLRKAWESKLAAKELHRLLAEIYIAADDLVKAETEVAFFKPPPQLEQERNEGYFYLTLARFHYKKDEFEEAQSHLQKARLRFEDTEQGMVVEIDLLWGEIKANQRNAREARQLLEQALENAQMLDCEERVKRVKEHLRNLP